MRIAIMTFTDGTNIGQRLQNYALQHVLITMGHDPYTIKQGYPFGKLRQNLGIFKKRLKNPSLYKCIKQRSDKFKKFNHKNIQFYIKELPFKADNTWIRDEFDAFIVGSDQVWNPKSIHVGDNFFLPFAQPRQMLTYAPSLSVDVMPDEDYELFKRRFTRFPYITVREDAGAKIIEEMTGKTAEVVLDPTLLLAKSDWDVIKTAYEIDVKKPYILASFLGEFPKDNIELIQKKYGYEVVYITKDSILSPSEFLDLLENASIVLTDSYHVTIFSIIYSRPFVVFDRIGNKINMGSRFKTLHRFLGTENRGWEYIQSDIDSILTVDFDSIYKKWQDAKRYSLDVLSDEIKMVTSGVVV